MTYLRLHEAPSDEAIPETFLFPGLERASPRVRPSIPRDLAIKNAEHGLDRVQERLNNLRDLVERFGLSYEDGPRAA